MRIVLEKVHFHGSETDFLRGKKTVCMEKKLAIIGCVFKKEALVFILHQIPMKHLDLECIHKQLSPVLII